MKSVLVLFALVFAAPISADTFTIPAEEFDWHTYPLDMGGYTEDAEFENIRELGVDGQLHIRYWVDSALHNYIMDLDQQDVWFEVCANLANLDTGVTNHIRINHPNPAYNKGHDLNSDQYQTLCSKQGPLGDLLRSAGVRVYASSSSPVEIRSIFFRPIEDEEPVDGALTTTTSPSWELDLYRSAVSTRPDGRPTYETNEQAWDVLTIGDVVYVGGEFQNIRNGAVHASPAVQYIAAFDRNTGEPILEFDIQLNGPVYALAASPDNSTLYIGGRFTYANGKYRKNFAAYDIENNNTSLSPLRLLNDGTFINPNLAVKAIAATEDRLFLGGTFTLMTGNPDYAHVAAFDRDSGEIIKSFKPKPNKRVDALIADGDEGLWLGGNFTKLNDIEKTSLALVSPVTGELLSMLPDVPYPVIDLVATPTQIFVAGGGINRFHRFTGNVAAAFDRITLDNQWELQGDGNVQGVDVDDGRFVYFGGHYQRFRYIRNSETPLDGKWVKDGDTVERLSRHDKLTGEIDFTWLPSVNGIRSVNAVDVRSDALYIVGDFFRVGGDTTILNDPRREDRRGFAIFKGDTQ